MTSNFSSTDLKLLNYLKQKSRFTASDSIMAGAQKAKRAKPDLTNSWVNASDDDGEASDFSGRSLDISDSNCKFEEELTSHDANIVDERIQGADSRRRSGRIARQSQEPENVKSKVTPPSSAHRTSARRSVEPSFIMPSLDSPSIMLGSKARHSPLSHSGVRVRTKRQPGSMSFNNTTKEGTTRPNKAPKISKQPSVLAMAWTNLIGPVLSYSLGVLGYVFVMLKPLFAVAVCFALLFFGLKLAFQSTFGALSIIPSVGSFISSPCSIPIMNLLPMCGSLSAAPEFEELITVQSAFEEILEGTSTGSILPLEMKRSEASIRDLKYVVTYSKLPSKNELVYEFESFIDGARQAANDLTRFNSRIGRAVDHIISTNKHTLQVIDGFVDTEASRGAMSKWLFGSGALTDEHLLRQYLTHTSQVEEQIQHLIIEAQTLLGILENLDGRLDVIHGIVTRDGVHVKDSRDELFASLWTKLGGNRDSVRKYDNQLQLLKSVNAYRKMAWKHVTATLMKLQEIDAGLEDLRDRVAMPEVLGVDNGIPLSQHINTIQLGVDRLEKVREGAKGLEMDTQRRVLDQGGVAGKDRMVEGGKQEIKILG